MAFQPNPNRDYCNSIKFVLNIFTDRVGDDGVVHLCEGDWLPVEVIIKLEKQAARRDCLYVRLCSINLRYGKVRACPGHEWEHDETSLFGLSKTSLAVHADCALD